MNLALSVLALTLQATPPPPPPVLVTPAPSPSASASVAPSPSPSPAATPGGLLALPAAVKLHPSQSQLVAITNASEAITAQVDSPLVSVSIDQAAHTITVTASTRTGRATLTVSQASGASIQIPVRVALDAGSIPASITLRVTGSSTDPAWLQDQVQKIVAQSLQLQPGATFTIAPFTVPSPFGTGAIASIPVSVHITGGDQYFDVNGTSSVTVQNVDVPAFLPPLLFYDDDPEKIVAAGVLYRNQVSADSTARLYYYHQNSGDTRRLYVVLRALQTPSTVHLIDSSAGPNSDVMTVGHNVTRYFLFRKTRNEGVIIDVTPGAPYVADQFFMQHLAGAAGNIDIHVLSGGPVQVTVVAVPEGADPPLTTPLDQPQLPGDGHHRNGAFRLDSRYSDEVLSYAVGGPDAMTQYGATSPPAADASAGHDYGDYGVLRAITLQLANPTPQPATVYLYERPMGGVVRSSFLIDGVLTQPGCARLPERYQLGTAFQLQPQSRYQIDMLTMTDGGSNYPLEVGVTTTPPLPTTPPINAPDGCFPK